MNRPLTQMNPIQVLYQLQHNPVQTLKRAGLNIPDNLNDANQIIQYLMNSNQISQQQYEQARQIVLKYKR